MGEETRKKLSRSYHRHSQGGFPSKLKIEIDQVAKTVPEKWWHPTGWKTARWVISKEGPALQVRPDDQSRYHNLKPLSSWGSGWNEIHCPPAKKKVKSFTSLQMFHAHTHTHTLERPHVAVAGGYFNSYEYNEKIPWNACCRDWHGWFLAWQPRRGKRKQSSYWKMEVLHFRTGTWILRPESISVTCNSLFVFVGLPLLQVRQSPCCETWKIEIRSKEHRHPLEKGLTHTHTHTRKNCIIEVIRWELNPIKPKPTWFK